MAASARAMAVAQKRVHRRVRSGAELLDRHYEEWFVLVCNVGHCMLMRSPMNSICSKRVLNSWRFFQADAGLTSTADLQAHGYLVKGTYQIGRDAEAKLLQQTWRATAAARMEEYQRKCDEYLRERERAEQAVIRKMLQGLHDDREEHS